MSLLSQQNFLNEMIEQLNIIIPKNQCDKIVEITKEILCSYNIELIDSNNDIFEKDTEIIELFLGSKEVSGRALSTIKHYRRILNKLIKDLNIPIKKITVNHLRNWLMKENFSTFSFSDPKRGRPRRVSFSATGITSKTFYHDMSRRSYDKRLEAGSRSS